MNISRRNVALGTASLLAGTGVPRVVEAEDSLLPFEGLDDFLIATDAYIYGYPLVTMEMTRRVMTNVAQCRRTPRAPMGQIIKVRSYPDASFRDVTAPNADTLYTTAWIDVGKEPWVLSIPDMKGRYFLFPMLDGWTNVFSRCRATRTTGTGAQTYAITGPGWKGTLPAGIKEYKSPTNIVWILGRIYCTGTPEDYAAVHALQDQVRLVPLSAYGKPYTPPPGKVDPVDRHEDGGARPGEPDGRGGLFHAAGAVDEGTTRRRRRMRRFWRVREDRPGARARISTPASWTPTSPSASRRSRSTASCCSSRSTAPSRTSMAGPTRRRPASMAPTI